MMVYLFRVVLFAISYLTFHVAAMPLDIMPRHSESSKQHSSDLSEYHVPLSNGTTSLPSPGNAVLKAIAIGRGTQNYTCASSDGSAIPVSVGAKATLYSTDWILKDVFPEEGKRILDFLPGFMYQFSEQQLSDWKLPVDGYHYFNAASQPTFDLCSVNDGQASFSKKGDIKSPAKDAVDWLSLSALANTAAFASVYRVHTFNGKPPATCSGMQSAFEVQYASQYWFYA